jgi:cellobiose phosphorylase
MRDSSQDVLAVVPAIPGEARAFLRTLLSFQKCDGSAMHQFNPLTMEGSEGESREMEDRPRYYGDDHLWPVLGVAAYLKETGDFGFLDQVVPFYDKDRAGKPLESGTVMQHLPRAVHFSRTSVGIHGLPLLGFADWNDTVNLPEGAESLFVAHLWGRAVQELIEMHEYLGHDDEVANLGSVYDEMRRRVEEHAWDGEWYLRYFDEAGEPVGSSKNTYGQIYLNAQSWAVLSGFASPERARLAMDQANSRLNTKFGLKVFTPGFDGFDPHYGGVTTYPPGTKENGGIFLHTNPWAVIAETLLGNGDRAYEYYSQINPAAKNDIAEQYEIEPYVYAQNVLSDEHPQAGLGRNSWLSGTASWCYQAATQWILGIRPAYAGLRVAPCLPSAWDGFSASRRFRGADYNIVVSRGKVPSAEMTVDGRPVEGDVVPAAPAGATVRVHVVLPAAQ